jgi:hypothetical protein
LPSSAAGLGLVGGIRLYATVLVVGLGVRFDLIAIFAWLSPKVFRLSRLEIVALLALGRFQGKPGRRTAPPCVKCAATKSVGGLRSSIGYLCLDADA